MTGEGVLLLGGGGFIGTALSRRLVADGHSVHVIGRSASSPTLGVVNHVGNIDDADLLATLKSTCRTVVHLASNSNPSSSRGHPTGELDDLAPTLRLLESLRQWKDTHVIFLSSGGTVYGNPDSIPVAEDSRLAPLSYHGAGKVALEAFFRVFAAEHSVSILRLANTYGPGQKLAQGFGLIRTVLQHILQGSTLDIWGNGENVRDFIFVDDAVDAIVRIINAPECCGTFNVGSGEGHSIREVLTLAEGVCAMPLHINYHPARNTDVREIVLDISRIRKIHDWSPKINLQQGIVQTCKWLREHG